MAKKIIDNTELYRVTLEMHNKVADCLSHLAAEKESMEDAIDALNRVKKMSRELDGLLAKAAAEAGLEYDTKKQLRALGNSAKRLEKILAEHNSKNKFLFGAAGIFAQSWGLIEGEVQEVIGKSAGKAPKMPPYIR
ncbi:MAG: hypothetical protein KGH54_02525 [Candidatus Micrarchaeota archaeon]|nr:hypothetical protein [Candidatus Micrarchaeota archaeon]